MTEILEKANELLQVQGTEGNFDYNDYMTGMYNGMELIVSLFEEREPEYKDCIKLDREKLCEEYKNRFSDIKLITFSEKKGTTTVILKDGVVGTVLPCPKDKKKLDERVGILEAYIKAIHNSNIIGEFCDNYDLIKDWVKVTNTQCIFKHDGVFNVDPELSLREKLYSAIKQKRTKDKQKKINKALDKLI